MLGDFGVLPPEWEVRGEEGGLSWEEFCLDLGVSCDAMATAEADEVSTAGAARFRRRVHVTMSVLSSV